MDTIKFKKLNEFAKEPLHGSADAAGWDLYAAIYKEVDILPHETVKIGTGLSMELPKNTFGAIFARSGLATKKGVRPANCVGVCDADYRGEYIVALHNDSEEEVTIYPGDRIAQLILLPFIPFELEEVEELDETERGAGGFGSTGTN
jgi:dUTP pyrophosphatase